MGEPVPARDALSADDEVVAEGRQCLEDGPRLARQIAMQDNLSGAVEHTEVEGAPVEIDAAGESVGSRVELHAVPPLARVSATLKATAWIASEGACMSFTSLERTRAG